MTYVPVLLAVVVLLCSAVISFSVWYDGVGDVEPYSVGFVFGALSILALLTILGA